MLRKPPRGSLFVTHLTAGKHCAVANDAHDINIYLRNALWQLGRLLVLFYC